MTDTPTRRRGRPARTVLTSEKIVHEARRLVRSHGENFTMSMLARRLGVAVSSLYNHVPSKDEVLARISDDVVQGINLTPLEALAEAGSASPSQWREATEAWARSYFAEFARQPSVVPALAITPIAEAPGTLHMYEVLCRAFLAAGWREDEALDLVESLESLLLGSALDAAAPQEIYDPGARNQDFPTLARLHAARERLDGIGTAARALEACLPHMLDGMEEELAARQR